MRMSDRDPTQYRLCVGVMLVNGEGKAFVGKRIDNKEGDFWQMPQGGVDPGEDPGDAVLRELWEETGASAEHVQVIARLPEELFYDLPDNLKGKLWGGRYIGQRQAWYLARFTGTDAAIDLEAHDPPEFCEFKWVEPALLPELIVPFKREVYAAVVAEFESQLGS
ncbi:RNA pyrophosphohydrolase [Altererythrobacter soli]|uniref:RNA pyrophosphohydrolase n=2 Tax=Croceibacterium soli TaxID=1739690 RepID=A0A6I4UT46_9SPHN|nr:RNA pyrophosphohydrolase [Croceibacterium soli]MXP40869.1 RNA pyrophosphohydrolase [Croceibacterium soli]